MGLIERPPNRLRATKGSAVLDRDGIQIGVVAATWGGVFQVATSSDFLWLSYEVAREIVPGERVSLSITAAEACRH